MYKSERIMKAIGNISDDKIENTARALGYQREESKKYRPRRVGRTVLIAAVIVTLLITMCAAAYALNLFGIKDLIMPMLKGWTSDNTTVLSAQGLQSSREYMAYHEFQLFYDDYVANDYYGDQIPQEMDDWMQQRSNIYFCYTDTLKNKILDICGRYDLSLRNERYDNSGLDNLGKYIGVSPIISVDGYNSNDAGFIAYDDGSFLLQNGITDAPFGYIETTLIRNVKGYFSQGYLEFPEGALLDERNYVTAEGKEILIVSSGTKTMLLYDGEHAFVSMSLSCGTNIDSYYVDHIADRINFIGLGAASKVDPEAQSPAHEPRPFTAEGIGATSSTVEKQTVGIGDSFNCYGLMDMLEITVTEMTISNNMFDAGWQLQDIDVYSAANVFDNSGTLMSVFFPDYIDRNTGTLIEGVKILTVDLIVGNRSTESIDIGAGTNVFPYCLLHLIDITQMQDQSQARYADCIAYKGAETATGHGACITLAPGECKTYELGYILDAAFDLQSSYLATVGSIMPGVFYLPVSLASEG